MPGVAPQGERDRYYSHARSAVDDTPPVGRRP